MNKERLVVQVILSSTVAPVDGEYSIRTLSKADVQRLQLAGIAHYVGHPSTKEIIEKLGAIPAPTKLFKGLAVGERALTVSLAVSNRTQQGFTVDQHVTVADLQFRIMERLS